MRARPMRAWTRSEPSRWRRIQITQAKRVSYVSFRRCGHTSSVCAVSVKVLATAAWPRGSLMCWLAPLPGERRYRHFGGGPDEDPHLGVRRHDVGFDTLLGQRRVHDGSHGGDHKVLPQGLAHLIAAPHLPGHVEQVDELNRSRENDDVAVAGGDAAYRFAQRFQIAGQGPPVDRNAGDLRAQFLQRGNALRIAAAVLLNGNPAL